MPRRDSQVGYQRDASLGVKGGRSACVRLKLRVWALKCIEKRRLYIREVYLWAQARSERRGKRQKEAIGMDAASGSGLGRSTNRPTIEPSDRPVRNGRSTLLLTVRTNREKQRKERGEDSRARRTRRGKQPGKRRRCLTPSSPGSTNGRVTLCPRASANWVQGSNRTEKSA